MFAAALLLVSALLAAQSPNQPVDRPATASACSQVSTDALTDVAVGEICAGDDAARAAVGPFDSTARTRSWRTAADHYRKAATLSSKVTTKVVALNALSNIYDDSHLDDVKQLEATLRELITLKPDDLSPMYRLAKVQESHGLIDAAEDTLQQTRRLKPDAVEPYDSLSAFYSRQAAARRRTVEDRLVQPERGNSKVYRVGGDLRPPARVTDVKPVYPAEALAARVQGVVVIEVVVNEFGNVTQPRILRSIPLLDEAALEAVRQWQFAPSILNGRPVPVVMTTTVNFVLPPADSAPPNR